MQQNCALIENLLQEFGHLEDTPLSEYEKDIVNSKHKNLTTIGNNLSFNYNRNKNVLGTNNMRFNLTLLANHMYQRMHYRRGAQIDTVAHRNMLLPYVLANLTKPFKKNITIKYQSNFNATSADFEQTMRYTDDTNPLYIVQGNPNLHNSSTWENRISSTFNIPKQQIMATFSASLVQTYNAQSTILYYNPATGAYRMVYDNAPGGHRWNINGTLDWKIAQKTSLRYTPGYTFNKTYRYLTINEDNPQYLLNSQRSNDIVNNLNLRWYNDICELKFFANTALRKYSNTQGAYDRYTYFDYNIGIESSVELCTAVKVELDLALDGKNGYLQKDMNKDRWLMDASVALRMLKGKGTLTLSAIDILRQQNNRSYNITAASRSETRTYGLTHYYMLSFSYMFGKPKGQ